MQTHGRDERMQREQINHERAHIILHAVSDWTTFMARRERRDDWTVNWPISWRRTHVAATLLARTDVNRDLHVAAPEDDDLIYGARPLLAFLQHTQETENKTYTNREGRHNPEEVDRSGRSVEVKCLDFQGDFEKEKIRNGKQPRC